MKTKYTEAFIEQALVKLYTRGDKTVKSVAEDLNVSCQTLKNWMKRKSVENVSVISKKEKRPQDWIAEERLVALLETHTILGENLNAWCREKGLFTHNLTSWRSAFCAMDNAGTSTREMRPLKEEIEQLKRELVRKEKALAEAAALLILQKKFRALWEGEVK